MPEFFKLLFCALIGYLLGSINSAVIVSKLKGKDIRTVGSGNAGATNILRTFGKGAAAVVFLVDILKGVFAALLGKLIGGELGGYLGGFLSIIGHNFPVYFGFRGGKGIVTSLAVMLTVSPSLALIAFGIGIIIIAATRYVSLGSIIGSLLFGILAVIRHTDNVPFCIFAALTALLATIRHAGNIKRLLTGTERKLGK